jgi:hypothetical protein
MLPVLRRKLLTLAVAALLLQFVPRALARTRPRLAAFDKDYSSALATADRFLHAWQTQDAESGILLLTDRARQRTEETRVHEFFSAERSGSFEIGRGKKLAVGRYEFPVALFAPDAARIRESRPKTVSLIVVKIGHDDWAVDQLP